MMERLAYLDCPAGVAGDMTLAALIAAGADIQVVRQVVDAVAGRSTGLDTVRHEGSGLSGLRLHLALPDEHAHRSMSDIGQMITRAASENTWPSRLVERALAIFGKLADAEGRVHGVPPDNVEFHEIGAMDSIVDIVGTAAALESLGIDRVTASPLPSTSGYVRTAHGMMPLPAPATLEVLKGYRVYGEDARGEFVTPTGAAICATLAVTAGPMPTMNIRSVGLGFGVKEWPDGRPNCVRVVTGERETHSCAESTAGVVIEMSANIDDCTPDQVAGLVECLMSAGALDAWVSTVFMKKGRPGFKVSALCGAGREAEFARIFFTESTTIGVRSCRMDRIELQRTVESTPTSLGTVRVKTAFLDGVAVNRLPEADDLRELARKSGKTLKEIRRIIESETA